MIKTKILIVDDELNIRETINELLILKNYETKTAQNGQEALDLLDQWTPDLIISDIMMPVMDGQEFQKRVHENKFLSTIPFIFLTAKNETNLMRKCFNAGADDFLSKPFKIDELLKVIETKLSRFKKIKDTYNTLYTGKKKYFSHEINTPLHGILGSIDLLIENADDLSKNDIITFYESIKESGERLNRTMQNLILFENIKSNNFQISENEHCEIKNIFSKVQKKLNLNYKDQENRISSDLKKEQLKISNKNLTFILFEILDNALKFSANNKKVVIKGENYNDDYYEIKIFDSGIGFKEEDLKKIDAAVQFNREEIEQQGLGLGLFLSKFIIKKSKGAISISSKENEKTKVSILLPIYK
jgi:two-component system, sensor histidine kinase and response regulator